MEPEFVSNGKGNKKCKEIGQYLISMEKCVAVYGHVINSWLSARERE